MSPFGYGRGEGVDAGHGDPEWICSKEKPHYDQIFQSLNPMDGKVTGAGTCPTCTHSAPLLHTHSQSSMMLELSLQSLLSAAHCCSLLTELSVRSRRHHADLIDNNNITDTLSLAIQNCTSISQLLLKESSSSVEGGASGAVSIHSVPDSSSSDRDSCVGVDSDLDDSRDTETTFTEDTERDPPFSPDPEQTPDSKHSPLFCVKFIFLLLLNLLSMYVIAEALFIGSLYATTGRTCLEFHVEKKPSGLYENIKWITVGLQRDQVRIDSLFQMFYPQNIIFILKYLLSNLESFRR